jgi:hypothetical protein
MNQHNDYKLIKYFEHMIKSYFKLTTEKKGQKNGCSHKGI